MKTAFAIHSYKGGTGKTTIAANLAALYAKRGKKVCILDFDFRAPSLHSLFKIRPRIWLNDSLGGKRDFRDALYEINVGDEGELAVGCANPSSKAMWDIARKTHEDPKWWASALRLLLDAKRKMFKDSGFDYLLFDTSPGVQESSMSAIAVSDIVLLTLRRDELDIEGTRELVERFHKILARRTAMILNKVLSQPHTEISQEEEISLSERVKEKFDLDVLGVIPCFCDLSCDGGQTIYCLERPDHPFVKRLSTISDRIDKLQF